MISDKYIGLDVHQSTISIAVLDSGGKLVMESIIETKPETILQFFHGLRGNLSVTFEEGTCAAWLYDLLKPPRVNRVVVCNPRKSALLKSGNKSDRIDARKLAETPTHRPSLARLPWRDRRAHLEGAGLQLSNDHQRSHASHESPQGSVSELGHSLCRSAVYAPRDRAEWLLSEAGVRHRAEQLYQQLDVLQSLRHEARRELLAESRKHPAARVLRKIPYLGPVRVAVLIALLQTPHRFRTKRQLWAYSGLALETHTSAHWPSWPANCSARGCCSRFVVCRHGDY